MSRKTVRVELFEYGYSDELMPLADFLAQANAAYETVPEAFRTTAMFKVDYRWGEDGSSTFAAYYERPENDDEMKRREEQEEAWRRDSAQRELNTYLSLKAKYGDLT